MMNKSSVQQFIVPDTMLLVTLLILLFSVASTMPIQSHESSHWMPSALAILIKENGNFQNCYLYFSSTRTATFPDVVELVVESKDTISIMAIYGMNDGVECIGIRTDDDSDGEPVYSINDCAITSLVVLDSISLRVILNGLDTLVYTRIDRGIKTQDATQDFIRNYTIAGEYITASNDLLVLLPDGSCSLGVKKTKYEISMEQVVTGFDCVVFDTDIFNEGTCRYLFRRFTTFTELYPVHNTDELAGDQLTRLLLDPVIVRNTSTAGSR
ncbi:MAG: hypothetical protein QY319_03380 [Candidatus Kapaibacterium sp.]|nr:MAG: hypothetical protein QY319_03380 [Candidatus Kapabacteria bacterium]